MATAIEEALACAIAVIGVFGSTPMARVPNTRAECARSSGDRAADF